MTQKGSPFETKMFALSLPASKYVKSVPIKAIFTYFDRPRPSRSAKNKFYFFGWFVSTIWSSTSMWVFTMYRSYVQKIQTN